MDVLHLLSAPGLELGLVGALLAALSGGPLGIAAARRQLGRSAPSPLAAVASATAALLALEALLFAASALHARLVTPCSPLAGAPLFALVALPSALLAPAVGVLCAFGAAGRRGLAALLYFGAVAGSLAVTALAAYDGPTAAAQDHFLGLWPGPLYDEALAVDRHLLLFRAGTLSLWLCATALCAGLFGRPGPRRRMAVLAAVAGALGAVWAARAGGGVTTRAELDAALGGRLDGPRCELHFPREKPPAESARLLRDCEYDAAEVARRLGLAAPPRARVYVYRDAAEKRRLTGAGRTNFTKPWLSEIHLNDAPTPHPVLRHELVHALAAELAPGPLHVPARALLLVSAGLVEGLAEAADAPHGPFSLHEWTRAMRDQGVMPAPAALVGATGFLGAAPARAYTAAGSFLRWLLDTQGPARVRALYFSGDFDRAFGRSLPALTGEWERFLDGVTVPPELRAAAALRFRRGSLFTRACAREVAELEARAGELSAGRRPEEAAPLWRRAGALSGGDPAYLRAEGEAFALAGDAPRAEAAFAEALRRLATGHEPALRGALEAAVGDLRWRAGDTAGARERYRAALALAPEPAEERLLRAKLAAAGDPALAEAVAPWLLGAADPALALSRLARSPAPLARYLYGRAALARGAPGIAAAELGGAGPALGDPAFAREAARLAARALCESGRFDDALRGYDALARGSPRPAEREAAEDEARRCAFERAEPGAPPPDPGDWPGPG
ncbi:MAG TPA: type VI secretion system protein [Anaeromyxobacteraceae bacterium]|jgi:tetratricopeptide (TPR) repeat protein|nr:type VI secretion system protein [Anaeromyxobacteraceae bacterium]